MSTFAGEHFDLVMCNATLEHDRYFWRTILEIKRVLKPGGVAIIGVPGFVETADAKSLKLPKPPEVDQVSWDTSSLTFRFHSHPGDYWRFSISAVKEVFFEGYKNVHVEAIMLPPRIVGYGVKA
jgi:SAM-dependent methyltransferase